MVDQFKVCNLHIFRSTKMKLKEQDNSLFGTAIEKHSRIRTSGVHVFLLKSTTTYNKRQK